MTKHALSIVATALVLVGSATNASAQPRRSVGSFWWGHDTALNVRLSDLGSKSCDRFKSAFASNPGIQVACDSDDRSLSPLLAETFGIGVTSHADVVLKVFADWNNQTSYQHVATAVQGTQTQQVFNGADVDVRHFGVLVGPQVGTNVVNVAVLVGLNNTSASGSFFDRQELNGVSRAGRDLVLEVNGWKLAAEAQAEVRLINRASLIAGVTRSQFDFVPADNPARAENPVRDLRFWTGMRFYFRRE